MRYDGEVTERLQERREASYQRMGLTLPVIRYGDRCEAALGRAFAQADAIAEQNQLKVLSAMQKNRVSAECLTGTTGYGYNDIGRETLEAVYADCFCAEDALVRPQITCGTQALALALLSNLRPGDELLSPVGKPYDTLEEVIGIRPSDGSLAEYGISYRQVDLKTDGSFDWEGIRSSITPKTRLVTIQRSRGYQTRPSLSIARIRELIAFIRAQKPDLPIMVDNCYGEFVEEQEPLEAGADLIVGSLIKNPGGGLAPMGGYLAGKREMVQKAAYRLTSPGLGKEVGASLGTLPALYQGFFLAPVVTSSALKGAIFASALFEGLGFPVFPGSEEPRTDIIQSITLGTKEGLLAFCRGIQQAAPVDSHLTPLPWGMPGYAHDVIMAAGAFISGSSIELSCDGPVIAPYHVYFQGGLTWPHVRYGMLNALQKMADEGLCRIPDAGRGTL